MAALIIGHSFVRRMQEFLVDHPLDVGRQYPYVFTEGKGGKTVTTLWSDTQFISTIEPRVVVLDIGSNDLCNPSVGPVDLSFKIIELSGFILMSTPGIKAVVIMQIMHRGNHWRPRLGQRNLTEYNSAVDQTNQHLSTQCYQNTLPGLKFYNVKKMSDNFDSYLLRDGVHFNTKGQLKHRKNYRGALMEAYNNVTFI